MGDRLYQPSDARVFSTPDRAILALAKAPYARTSQQAGGRFGYYDKREREYLRPEDRVFKEGYKRSS
jgi:hypothetical protein